MYDQQACEGTVFEEGPGARQYQWCIPCNLGDSTWGGLGMGIMARREEPLQIIREWARSCAKERSFEDQCTNSF